MAGSRFVRCEMQLALTIARRCAILARLIGVSWHRCMGRGAADCQLLDPFTGLDIYRPSPGGGAGGGSLAMPQK